ncbi:MAG: hypothetical protein Q8N53_01900 [Longimicrobiales bacterium]|nr:hypothetical protein [Longimicrobiales bacterium]
MTAPLAPADEALVALSAALASRRPGVLEPALRRAATLAIPEAVEEALLQSYLFLGYPAALDRSLKNGGTPRARGFRGSGKERRRINRETPMRPTP